MGTRGKHLLSGRQVSCKDCSDTCWTLYGRALFEGMESGKRHLSVNLCWCIDFLKRLDGFKL